MTTATRHTGLPSLSPRLYLVRGLLLLVLAVSAGLLAQVSAVSAIQQRASQQRAFQSLRGDLAEGTAPLGRADGDGHELRLGSPVAYLEIPSIGLKQVVSEGTDARTLFRGPGHRRDTPLPGQAGVSVLLGRRSSYGGPFRRLDDVRKGATVRVTTGQGVFEFKVLGVRRKGSPEPPVLRSGAARLELVTATGRPFFPTGVLHLDADLAVPDAAVTSPAAIAPVLAANEQVMASDTSTPWALALWLQGLIAVVLGAVWGWHRLGRAKAWVILLPPLLLVGLGAAGETARLLPNLL